MQVKFITRGSKYDRTSISKNSFKAYLEDNKIIVMRTEDQIKHSHTNIISGVTRLTNGTQEWLITSFKYEELRPRFLIATVKEVR